MFDKLQWQPDRVLLGDLVFRTDYANIVGDLSGSDSYFKFLKQRRMVDDYASVFRRRPEYQPRTVFELGIFDGGSMAFWSEILQARKVVGIDRIDRGDSEYFRRYAAAHPGLKTYWSTDQTDRVKLLEIMATDFGDAGPDLVIDDCSHLYAPTKTSFETIFPLLRPGMLYIIEDWSWDHYEVTRQPGHIYAYEVPLSKLVHEIVEAMGVKFKLNKSKTGEFKTLIADVTIYSDFIVIERGNASRADLQDFSLDNYLAGKPQQLKRGWFRRSSAA